MENDWEETPVVSPTGKAKKKVAQPEKTGKQMKKKLLYSGKENGTIACTHTAKKNFGLCRADLVSHETINKCHEWLYSTTNKVKQDDLLLSLLLVGKTERKRQRVLAESDKKHNRHMTVFYTVVLPDSMERIPVCAKTFCSIFGKLSFHHSQCQCEKFFKCVRKC